MRDSSKEIKLAHLLPFDPDRKPIPLHQKAINFAEASVKEGKAIMIRVPVVAEDEAARRMAICRSCEFLSQENAKCLICGCAMERKTKWRTAKCPLPEPKWEPVTL